MLKKVLLSIAILIAAAPFVLYAMVVHGVIDIPLLTSCGTPATGYGRLCVSSVSNVLTCTLNGGTSCMPSGMVYPGSGIPKSTGSAWGTSYGAQGTDSNLLTAGTISGTGSTLCTDANGGATTSGCTGGGGSGGKIYWPLWSASCNGASNSGVGPFILHTASISGACVGFGPVGPDQMPIPFSTANNEIIDVGGPYITNTNVSLLLGILPGSTSSGTITYTATVYCGGWNSGWTAGSASAQSITGLTANHEVFMTWSSVNQPSVCSTSPVLMVRVVRSGTVSMTVNFPPDSYLQFN